MDVIASANKDEICFAKQEEYLNRIQKRLNEINWYFQKGWPSLCIQLFVSKLVTLECSNGKENISVQRIMVELKKRLDTLNQLFEEFSFEVRYEKMLLPDFYLRFHAFTLQCYQLFSIGKLVKLVFEKCVSFGTTIAYYSQLIQAIEPYTKMCLDSILFLETDEEFEAKILAMRFERK